MPGTSAVTKFCCKCGRNVAGEKRVKDHSGNYWCVECNRLQARREKLIEGGICAGCGEAFHGPGLTLIGHDTFCARCLRTRAKQETSGFVHNVKEMLTGSRDHEKRTTLMLLVISVVVVLVAVWHFTR